MKLFQFAKIMKVSNIQVLKVVIYIKGEFNKLPK